MKKAIRFEETDTVIVALEDVLEGDELQINEEASVIIARNGLPMGHKIAAQDIPEGGLIMKYGHPIGAAARDIAAGEYVHVHNVRDLIANWREFHQYSYDTSSLVEISESFRLKNPPKLTGYRRKNGMVGFRNYLVILSTTVCANQIVQDIGAKYDDVAAITNPSGCVILPNEVQRMKDILLGIARNPNVGAVIFVGLGCESIEAEWFYEQIKDEKPAAYVRAQDDGSTPNSYKKLEKLALEYRELLQKQEREEVCVADIRLGTQCGASDWTTAVASNPAIGFASDLVVKNGGISLLGETCGWFGGEEMLIKQSRTKEVADGILALMGDIYDRALAVGKRIEEGNPAPGNIAGGITTLNEKALGNIRKGGAAPVEGVLGVGEYPTCPGLHVVDNPGLDPVSLLGLVCSSANILIYSTGRGTPVGNPISPTIKLTASPDAMKLFGAHMDADLTGVITGDMTLEQAGRLLFEQILDTANGKQTIAERWGHREYAFPLLMGPL